jgi:hypothetical protein
MMKWFLFLFVITSAIAQQTITDLTVKDFKVVSTVKGSKPCPVMTDTQKNAIASPVSGQCVYSSTTNKLNVYNGSLWKAAGGGVDAWATSTVYAVDDLVIQSNKIYKCLTAHTSGTFATDLAATKWVEVSQGVTDHTNLSSIGTNTHAQIDTALTRLANTGGTNTGDQINITGNAATVTTNANLTGEATSSGNAVTLTNSAVIGKVLTGYTSGAGTISSSDSILGAIQKLNGNVSGMTAGNLTGAVTSTGLATVLGSFSSSNLLTALTDETGTGAAVFATTPALVTPILGAATGTSLVLGGTINANAVLDAQSTTKAFMPPRMTTTQKNAIASPTAGMVVYDSTLNSMSYYDGTAWGFGVGNLVLDNTFSAVISSAGVVSQENKDWINGNASVATSTYTITFNTGIFGATPNCVYGSAGNASNVIFLQTSVSPTSTVILLHDQGGGNTAQPFTISCQKSGVDYANSSSSVFTGASANYSRRAYTPTFTGFGTVSNINCYESRSGEFNDIDCSFTSGTSTSTEARVSLPNSNVSSASGPTIRNAGEYFKGVVSSTHGGAVLTELSTGYVTFGDGGTFGGSSISATAKANGDAIISNGNTFSFTARIPITGWSNLSQVVANISGYTQVPGVAGSANPNVDTFSVSYGTTNATTVCTASPCSYLDQIGNAVTSVNRSSAGTYVLNTTKTYTKIKCTGSLYSPDLIVMRPVNSASSNASTFFTVVPTTGVGADSAGTLDCIGSY